MPSPSQNTTPLGEWVDHIFYLAFFQPDDELSEQTIETSFSCDLKVRSVYFFQAPQSIFVGLRFKAC